MRPRREQMSQTLALSGEAPRNFNPPSLPRIFPELRAPLYWSRTDGGCNTLQHVPAETPVTRSAADQESRLRRLGRTDPQDRIGTPLRPLARLKKVGLEPTLNRNRASTTVLVCCLAIEIPMTAIAADIVGTVARVMDGNTFEIASSKDSIISIRLCGVHSPERSEPNYRFLGSSLTKRSKNAKFVASELAKAQFVTTAQSQPTRAK